MKEYVDKARERRDSKCSKRLTVMGFVSVRKHVCVSQVPHGPGEEAVVNSQAGSLCESPQTHTIDPSQTFRYQTQNQTWELSPYLSFLLSSHHFPCFCYFLHLMNHTGFVFFIISLLFDSLEILLLLFMPIKDTELN